MFLSRYDEICPFGFQRFLQIVGVFDIAFMTTACASSSRSTVTSAVPRRETRIGSLLLAARPLSDNDLTLDAPAGGRQSVRDAILVARKQEILTKLEQDLLQEGIESEKLKIYDVEE